MSTVTPVFEGENTYKTNIGIQFRHEFGKMMHAPVSSAYRTRSLFYRGGHLAACASCIGQDAGIF